MKKYKKSIDRKLLPTGCVYCPVPLRFNFLMQFTGHNKSLTAYHIKCYYKHLLKIKIKEIVKLIK